MGTSAWRPLAVARGGRFTSKTDGGSHREDPPPNEAMYCRAKATEAKRCAVGQVLAMYCRFAAAMLPDHVHHAYALPWLARAKSGAFEFTCSGHSLAEIYAVLTRLPRTPPISPEEALQLIQENVTSHARLYSLSSDEYALLIESLAKNGIIGGAVYDAVIACVAELTTVDYLVTLNIADFQRVWPAGAARIVSPQTHSPP